MLKTPVSVLQELIVKQHLPPPIYEYDGQGPAHSMDFSCSVRSGTNNATGFGKTKKDAKHDAAVRLLDQLGVVVDNYGTDGSGVTSTIFALPSPTKTPALFLNYVGQLNEFCSGHKFPQATYTNELTLVNSKFATICRFSEFQTQGFGSSKKDSKQDAAKKMMTLIKDKDIANNASLEVLQLNTKMKVLDLDRVIEKYDEVKKDPRLAPLHNNNNNNVDDETTYEQNNIQVENWDQLVQLFEKKGWSYKLSVFQQDPLILSLKINEPSNTLMQSGKTREEILQKLVDQVVMMMNFNYNFRKFL